MILEVSIIVSDSQEILAKIRTLLALERNFLAEERTALAEFRTGLAIALIAPTASTIIAYLSFLFETANNLFFEILIIFFFIVLTITGLWMIIRSRSKLKNIQKRKELLEDRKQTLIKNSGEACPLLADLLVIEKQSVSCVFLA